MPAPKRSDFAFSIQTQPSLAVLRAAYADAAEALGDFRAIWPALAVELGKGLGENLTSEGSTLSAQWPRLTDRYARRRRRAGFGDQPLQRTGELLRQLRSGTIVRKGKLSMSVGFKGPSAARYAPLTFGKTRGAKPRPFVGWSPSMQRTAEMLAEEHVRSVLREAARKVG